MRRPVRCPLLPAAVLLAAVATRPVAAQPAAGPVSAPSGSGPASAWWRHVQVLAHDSLKGRDAGSAGHEGAVRYVAEQFRAIGLQPGGTEGWLQRVSFVEVGLDAAQVRVTLLEPDVASPLVPGRDLRLTAAPATGDVDAPLVFAGYGLAFPEAGLDDLAGLDVRGAIVVYVNGVPAGLSGPLQAHASRARWSALQRAGAVGLLAIGAGSGWTESGSGATGASVSLADPSLDDASGQRVRGQLNPSLMPRLLAGSGLDWTDLQARAARGERLPTAVLRGRLRATLPTVRRPFTSPNVVGVLPGTDPALRDEVVVLTAHTDHVGTFKGPALTGDSVFNGAMDNASGTATLIETARAVVARGGNRRTIAFVGVTAEERGLLGSRHFAAQPSLGSGATIVANLNTDMFLPLNPLRGLFSYGYDESDLADDLDAVVAQHGLVVFPDPEPEQNRFVRSDQYSFIRQGIPALAFKVGYARGTPEEARYQAWNRDHYHKLSDDITQPVNLETAAGFNAMYADLALRVANRATRPAWRAASFFRPGAP